MFYAMAENKIDLRGYQFEHRLEDIQTLNERATARGAPYLRHFYSRLRLRQCALRPSALWRQHGRRLRTDGRCNRNGRPSSQPTQAEIRAWLKGRVIAVPGLMTSAYLALQLYLGEFQHVVVPFDEIFATVKSGRAAAGLIIHEGQLTYAQSGFTKIVDLGEWWKRETALPLPLGGNVLRKDIPAEVRRDLLIILRESIEYGLAHREAAVRHSMPYARDMDSALASQFIGMYVNDYTLDYGDDGRRAIREFLGAAEKRGYLRQTVELEFVS